MSAPPVPCRARAAATALALALFVFAAYLPVLENDFVNYDDQLYITEARQVRAGLGWESARWAFTTTRGRIWHPLTWLSHEADVSLFGLDPRGHHAVSLLLHAANTLLVFSLFSRLTGAPVPSAFVAAVFGVHPLHVESVAWAAERKDVLSTFFGLLALGCHLAWVRRRRWGALGAATLLFALSLLAKPMLVTLPALLLLLDWWPLGRLAAPNEGGGRPWWPRLAALLPEKLPYAALAAAVVAITFVAPSAEGTPLHQPHLLLRIQNALLSCALYVGKTLWPAKLAVFYPYPRALGWLSTFAAAGALAAASFLALRLARRHPALAAGWLWFLLVLVPVIGIVDIGPHALADRYTYLSMTGLTLLPAFALPWHRWKPAARSPLAGAACVVLVAAALTRMQVGFWRNSETLFGHALAVAPDNATARLNFAAAIAGSGRKAEAVEHCRAAVRLDPVDPVSLTTCGLFVAGQGAAAEAFDYYRRALAVWPGSAAAHNNLGMLLDEQGRHAEAVAELTRAIELQPDLDRAYNNLGNALLHLGRTGEALERFQESVRLAPGNAKAHYNLANLLAGIGREADAEAEYRLAVTIDPDFADAWNNLGGLAVRRGNLALARECLERALGLDPRNHSYRANLEAVRAADAGR